MPAVPATWTVSRPVRVWRLRAGEWVWAFPGDLLHCLHRSGPNVVALHLSEWVVIPPPRLDSLVLVPPATSQRSAS